MFDFQAQRVDVPAQAPSDVKVIGAGQIRRFMGTRFEDLSASQVRTAYRSIVSELISYRAENFAPEMNDSRVVRQESQRQATEVPTDHPWVQLLREPSPHLPATLFWEQAFKILDSKGHVDFAVRYRREMGRQVPEDLLIIYPEFGIVSPIFDETGDRIAWNYQRAGGGSDVLLPQSIVRLKEPHPTAPWRTAGKIEASAYEIDEMQAQNVFARDKARNQGRPNVVLQDESIETTADAKKLAKEFAQMYNEKTGLTPVERGGMEIKEMDLSPQEMEFLESRRFNLDKLFIMFGIPKGMLSSEDSATGRGRTAAERQFEKYTVQSFINKRCEQMSYELRQIFGAEDSDLRLEAPQVWNLPPDRRLDVDMKRMKTGTPPNRLLKERGEEEVEGGDEPLVSGAVQSLQGAGASLM
jgi:HK97 family phage portal protein